MKQNITILGSTGSIGTNTLDVLSNHLDRFQVFALTASKQVDLILAQCAKCPPNMYSRLLSRAFKQAHDTKVELLCDFHASQGGEKTRPLTRPILWLT